MTPKRDASKLAVRFHRAWVRFLLKASQQTMRRVCHELAIIEQENRQYRDGAVFTLLRRELEFVIRDTGHTSWTVQRSLRDLRGRTRRRDPNRRPFHIDGDLQRAIDHRIVPTISEAGDL